MLEIIISFVEHSSVDGGSVEAGGADPEGSGATAEEVKKKKKKKKKSGAADKDDFLHPASNPTGTLFAWHPVAAFLVESIQFFITL